MQQRPVWFDDNDNDNGNAFPQPIKQVRRLEKQQLPLDGPG